VKNIDNGMPPSGGGWKPASGPVITGRLAPPPVTGPAGPASGLGGGPGPTPPTVRPPSAPRERRPALIALGLLLVLCGVLASVYLQQRAGDRVGVVEITKRVPQGQPVADTAITEVMVAVDSSISYVTWAQRGLLSQYTAETDLLPGTILVGQMLTTSVPLPQGSEVVGVSLKEGQYPSGIQDGDTVSAYFVSNKNDQNTGQQYLGNGFTTGPVVAGVKVYSVGTPSTTSSNLDISLVLAQQDASAVVQAASGGNLVLVFDKHTE
jgi:hypothetical protein